MELLYFANPYCSWCWGFVPILEEVRRKRPNIAISLALGRLGVNDTRSLSAKARATILEHWQHVTEISGQPFDTSVLERPDLIYNTAPACQVLMLIRQTYPKLATAFLGRLGERFFTLGDDLSDPKQLGQAAAEFGLDAQEVELKIAQGELQAAMTTEWQQTEALGVTGYPTLLALDAGKVEVVTIGWATADQVLAQLP